MAPPTMQLRRPQKNAPMVLTLRNDAGIILAIAVLSVAIFGVDLLFPLGVAAGVPYIVVVLLSRWLGSQRGVLVVTAAVSALTVVGFFIPLPKGPMIWIGAENRVIALFTLWTTALLVVLLIRRTETIRIERDFNKGLVETAASIILLIDNEGNILYFNAFTALTTGLALKDAVGKNWLEALVPRSEWNRAQRLLAAPGDSTTEQEAVFSVSAHADEPRSFSWAARATTGGDGDLHGALLIGQDITPLVEAQRRLVQSERLAAIGQTVASLSHEIRNELHSLELAVRLLERLSPEGPARQSLDRIRGIAERLRRLFEDIRGYATPIQLERSDISLADVWREAWAVAIRNHSGQAKLVESVGDAPLRLSLDGLRMHQVFRNLFDNALAACGDSAVVTVECTVASRDGNEFVRVRVRDNGPGLTTEAKQRIFEPFFTTKSAGTGLGMPICRRMIEAHGGDMQVGECSQGAEFLLYLPFKNGIRAAPPLRDPSKE